MSTYSGFLASSAPASRNRFERKRDALPAADAEGDHAALQAVAAHRVDEAGREHGARGADRVTMRDGAALDIDDVGREAELARHGDDDGGEGLVDLDALDLAEGPARAGERLLHRRDRPEAEHAGLDRGDAIGDESGQRLEAALLGPSLSAASASRVVPGRLCSSLSKTVGPLRPASSIGRISSLNLPAAWAAPKRCCVRSAHWSCASRVIWNWAARSSVCQPEAWSEKASLRPSRSMLS